MKELELTCRLRNNRLKERRLALGLQPQELAEQVGISYHSYLRLEGLTYSPIRKNGEWSAPATKLSVFFKTLPEELFPDAVLKVQKPVIERKLDFAEIAPLLAAAPPTPEECGHLLPPDEAYEQKESRQKIDAVLGTLTEREQKIIRARFGLNENGEDHTLDETAPLIGRRDKRSGIVTREVVRQAEAKALRKLRHPSRSRRLPDVMDEPLPQERAEAKVHEFLDEFRKVVAELMRLPPNTSIGLKIVASRAGMHPSWVYRIVEEYRDALRLATNGRNVSVSLYPECLPDPSDPRGYSYSVALKT